MNKKGVEQNPLILTFFQQNRIAQLIRMMLNRKTSEEYLIKYGQKPNPSLKKHDQHLIQDYINRFYLKDIIHLKGSQKGNIQYYCNTFISEILIRKLRKGYKLTNEERRLSYVQLTQYFQLQNLYEGLKEIQLPGQVLNIIQKDVKRTYISPDLHLNTPNNIKILLEAQMRERLNEILQQIAKYNPYIGYCQGMNTIILFFIQQKFTNQQIFFIFKKITEQLLPCDFYSSMDSTMAFVKILFQILHLTHPKSVKKMKQIIVSMGGEDRFIITMSFIFQWFICIFTNVNLSRQIRLKIMDHFLIQGITILFKASLAFFDVFEPIILKVSGFQEYIREVQRMIRQFNNEEVLNNRLHNTYINKTILQLLKQKLMLTKKPTRQQQTKENCNRKWNICLQSIQQNLAEGKNTEFFVFKTNQQLKIIENYFDKFKNQYFRIGKTKQKSDLLRLGRMNHICRYNSMTSKTNDDQNKSQNSIIQYKNQFDSNYTQNKASPFGKKVTQFQQTANKLDKQQKKQLFRAKALQNLQKTFQNERQSVINRSQSMQFMRSMIQNESFSNLMEILQVSQMQSIFKDVIEEKDD